MRWILDREKEKEEFEEFRTHEHIEQLEAAKRKRGIAEIPIGLEKINFTCRIGRVNFFSLQANLLRKLHREPIRKAQTAESALWGPFPRARVDVTSLSLPKRCYVTNGSLRLRLQRYEDVLAESSSRYVYGDYEPRVGYAETHSKRKRSGVSTNRSVATMRKVLTT